ncbi:MAG: efflux RND transporter periplasmic adaptor subunit [Phycisphaerales bacterium]
MVIALLAVAMLAQTDAPPAPEAPPAAAWRGMAMPAKQATLNAPVDGNLAATAVSEGQRVRAGDLLITMDDGVQQAVVRAAELKAGAAADLDRAKLELEEARITLDRLIEAQKNRAAQEWEVRRAALQRDIAQVAVVKAGEDRKLAEAELQLEQQRLARFKLTSPWDGIVVRVLVKPGATLSRSDAVLKLVALDQLEAEIYVPAEQFSKVKVGRVYALAAGVPVNRDVEAKLKFADPVIDPASQTFRCVFAIDNADLSLPAGFVVQWREAEMGGDGG